MGRHFRQANFVEWIKRVLSNEGGYVVIAARIERPCDRCAFSVQTEGMRRESDR